MTSHIKGINSLFRTPYFFNRMNVAKEALSPPRPTKRPCSGTPSPPRKRPCNPLCVTISLFGVPNAPATVAVVTPPSVDLGKADCLAKALADAYGDTMTRTDRCVNSYQVVNRKLTDALAFPVCFVGEALPHSRAMVVPIYVLPEDGDDTYMADVLTVFGKSPMPMREGVATIWLSQPKPDKTMQRVFMNYLRAHYTLPQGQ